MYHSVTVTVLFSWDALSDERTGVFFFSILLAEALETRDHILLSHN
jgi:hypothetical protein